MSVVKLRKELVDRIRLHQDRCGLRFKEFGKSPDLKDYTDYEIAEMYFGIYKYSNHLLDDGDLFLNVNEVVQMVCELHDVSYYQKPTRATEYMPDNRIQNIRSFYVEDYFLITENEKKERKRHIITRYLQKAGAINTASGQHRYLYRINNFSNAVKEFKQGIFPVDLFTPLRLNINRLFYKDDYKINDFVVESDIKIEG